MPTYNRFPKSAALVNEAIESFLRQTWENKELIILNDTPNQTLRFDHPDVVVVNSPRRFRTMGEKLNAAFGLATGDVLCRFDDDDVSLPWRLETSFNHLTESTGLNYWSSFQFFFANGENAPRISRQGAPSKSIWTRKAFDAVNGFPFVDSGQDKDFEYNCRIHDPKGFLYEEIPPKEIFYVYRWGTGSVHLSGLGRGSSGYHKIGQRPIEAGDFELAPVWGRDWVEEMKTANEK